ncbi:hypothetical protein E2562_017929 [Oryza meyeriana var. granulata]|uniref:Uncharacterized protein n=1 Tax=Oryza meyeriana var. granulata TaxID=110450 RepID=A0A6G1CR43_9ORYZ|nr:hypothetical protein E2562_017929 [Oryza meyeriana var. granulata]
MQASPPPAGLLYRVWLSALLSLYSYFLLFKGWVNSAFGWSPLEHGVKVGHDVIGEAGIQCRTAG